MHPLRIRLKNIQNQSPASVPQIAACRVQVLAHRFKARNLRVNFQKMLHRPKRNNHHAKFFAQIEPRHVSLHQMHSFARFRRQRRPLLVAPLQHSLRNVQPRDAMPRFRQRQRNAPRPAPQLEHWVAVFVHCIAVERYIPGPPAHNRRLVVIICNESVVKRCAHIFILAEQTDETRAKF